MRACFFNRSYWPDFGATGQLLTELAEDLAAVHGWDVSVVPGRPLRGDGPSGMGWRAVHRESRGGVHIFRASGTTFSPRRFVGRVTNYVTYFLSSCLAGLVVPRPDVVVSLTDPPIIGLAALLCARLHRARFVFLCQDLFPEVARLLEDFRSPWIERRLDSLNRFLIRRADVVVALGETMARRLIEVKGADPRKVVIIHNWADCRRIVPASKRNPFSLAHGLDERFVVMHSGNVGLSQELETLLDVAEHLRGSPEILVAIVGDGARRRSLEEDAARRRLDNVRFFPYQSKDGVTDSFATADVFVVSLKAGMAGCIVPSKLYGILAAGRAYVAAVEDDCEVVAITRQYDCGLLAEPGKARDLAEKILKLYHDRPLMETMAANARRAALDFDRCRQVARYDAVLTSVVRGEPARP